MRLLILLLYAVSVVNGSLDARIVGGDAAQEGRFVYQVAVKYRNILTCGGSIINSRHILTAAHCIYRLDPKLFKVVVGTIYLNKGGETYLAEALLWPINYDEIKIVNDIGLIRLTKHIIFNSSIQPVILPSTYYVPEGETAVISGWGRLNKTGSSPVTLQELSVVVISQSLCDRYYWELSKNSICTHTNKTIGVCFGDSGGPLVLNGVQIGVVSYGRPCATGSPDVYTRVYPYTKWIQVMLESTECVQINATNHIHINIWIVLSLTILTLVSYSNLL
ncbi:chymotrypsin-2-like [Megachile rotundata]|uniref:chymotrypsin-2-like n=1 Tax=Megachile rotundata TaxID=143995 RepID=UPI000615292C|nr:PREDICTED: chymotrypsin-2-like [Megachile rotundata]